MNTRKLYKCLPALAISLLLNSIAIGQTKQTTINYTSFTVNQLQKKIVIEWVTNNKELVNYFEIQRSTDGLNFRTVALVMGPDPKQSGGENYECFDKPAPKIKKYFYRLNYVDSNGASEISETKMIAINN
jgi:hypothetical protein